MNITSKEPNETLPVKIDVEDGQVRVHSPFNYGFVDGA